MESNELIEYRQKTTKFLTENFVMNLATTFEDEPSVAPVIYVIDGELNFYFVTSRMSRKSQQLIQNPNCSLTVWQFLEMSVQANGIASLVEDDAKKEWVIEAFGDAATKDPNFWAPIFRISRGDYCVFKIKPTWLRTLDLTRNTIRQEGSPFIEIINEYENK